VRVWDRADVVQVMRPPRPSVAGAVPVLRRSSSINVTRPEGAAATAKPPMPGRPSSGSAAPMAVDGARASQASLAGSTLATLRAKCAPDPIVDSRPYGCRMGMHRDDMTSERMMRIGTSRRASQPAPRAMLMISDVRCAGWTRYAARAALPRRTTTRSRPATHARSSRLSVRAAPALHPNWFECGRRAAAARTSDRRVTRRCGKRNGRGGGWVICREGVRR